MIEFIGWILVVALVLALIYIIVLNIYKARMRKPLKVWKNGGDLDEKSLAKVERYIEKFGGSKLNWDLKDRQRQRDIEYNKAHLPFAELPELSIDCERFGKIVIKSSGLALRDDGDSYACLVVYASEHYKRHSIPKSELDGDTIKLIELIERDVDWFYGHHTGNSAGECGSVLESFLRQKYPKLTEESVSCIVNRYCINDR